MFVARVRSKVTKVSWVVAGGFAAWAAARILAADRLRRTDTPVAPLMSFTPQVASAAPWAVLGLRLAGQRRPAATAALAATALGLAVRPRGNPRTQPLARGSVLRVITANLYVGRADAETIVGLVRQFDADVLFVQELTEDAVTRLKQAGLEDLLPHAQPELRGGSQGSGLYSRFPLGDGPEVPPVTSAQPTALIELPSGEEVELVCVHPAPPALAQGDVTARWKAELAVLPAPGERPRVVAGDFNATLDHAPFRDLLRLGYVDAARQTGNALTPTWGIPGKSPLFALDHVLVSSACAVLASSVHAVPDSDHRAVYAEIQLP